MARLRRRPGQLAVRRRDPDRQIQCEPASSGLGTIAWQIGLGDDLRLAGQGVTGTGTAATVKGGIIVTSTGLLFVTAADRKVHVYDSTSGTQLWELPLGGATGGGPSMYELGGRQYLLVTASAATGRGDASTSMGPTGIVAFALPRN